MVQISWPGLGLVLDLRIHVRALKFGASKLGELRTLVADMRMKLLVNANSWALGRDSYTWSWGSWNLASGEIVHFVEMVTWVIWPLSPVPPCDEDLLTWDVTLVRTFHLGLSNIMILTIFESVRLLLAMNSVFVLYIVYSLDRRCSSWNISQILSEVPHRCFLKWWDRPEPWFSELLHD
jgi:hypothetical protein